MDELQAVAGVLIHCDMEQTVAIRRIVEIRDRIMKRSGGEIRKLILKTTESNRALIEIRIGFRRLKAEAVYKLIATPITAALIAVVILSVEGRDKIQNLP